MDKIGSNIMYAVLDRIFWIVAQFISSILIIRLLARESFGIIGVVAGLYAILNLLNISLEAVIVRDHKKFQDNLSEYLSDFMMFNVGKSLVILFLGAVVGLVLTSVYHETGFWFSVASITMLLVTESLIAPLVVYANVSYRQKFIMKVNIARSAASTVLLVGLIVYPSLLYIACKDVVVSVLTLVLWFGWSKSRLALSLSNMLKFKKVHLTTLKEYFLSFSLWSHLVGVASNFTYRADAFFLSLFSGLGEVGNYNIALSAGNSANILPSVLSYQNSIALSNAENSKTSQTISQDFLRWSVYLNLVTFVGFAVLGSWYLYLLTGVRSNPRIYFNFLCIVLGLTLAKSITGPIMSHAAVNGSLKRMFWRVSFPAFLVAFATYPLAAWRWQAVGVAVANIIIAAAFLLFAMKEGGEQGFEFPRLSELPRAIRRDVLSLVRLIRL
jgi:O-antigen/teichoic acid export membrane protein